MNRDAMDFIDQVASQTHPLIDYREQNAYMRCMGLVCHCSGEIDENTMMYFRMNRFFLEDTADYLPVLFAYNEQSADKAAEDTPVQLRIYAYSPIAHIACEVLTGKFTFYISELDGRLVILFQFGREMQSRFGKEALDNRVFSALLEIASLCESRYSLPVIAYCSHMLSGVKAISGEYHKLLNMVTYFHYIEKIHGLRVVRIQIPFTSEGIQTQNQAELLMLAIAGGGEPHTVAGKQLSEISQGPLSVEELKQRFTAYFEAFCLCLYTSGITVDMEQSRMELFGLFLSSIYWREITEWFHTFIDKVIDNYNTYKKAAKARKLSAAKEYVLEHLGDYNLSVAKISEAVGMNRSFLSAEFKKQYQISVSEFIKNCRLEEARKLLESTEFTMPEICRMIGLGSVETFHRLFRQKFGCSPGMHRKRVRI